MCLYDKGNENVRDRFTNTGGFEAGEREKSWLKYNKKSLLVDADFHWWKYFCFPWKLIKLDTDAPTKLLTQHIIFCLVRCIWTPEHCCALPKCFLYKKNFVSFILNAVICFHYFTTMLLFCFLPLYFKSYIQVEIKITF